MRAYYGPGLENGSSHLPDSLRRAPPLAELVVGYALELLSEARYSEAPASPPALANHLATLPELYLYLTALAAGYEGQPDCFSGAVVA